MEYEPFIESQLVPRNEVQGRMWCKSGHVTPGMLGERNLRTPPCALASNFRFRVSGFGFRVSGLGSGV